MKLYKWLYNISCLLVLVLLISIAYADESKGPTIFSVIPKVVDPGGELTIKGEFVTPDKKFEESTVLVEIDGKNEEGFIVTKAGSEIKLPSVPYPPSAPNGLDILREVVVFVNGKRSNAFPFRQSPNPLILSVSPEIIKPGDKITLTGNFVILDGDPEKKVIEVKVDTEDVEFLVTKAGKEIVIPRIPMPPPKEKATKPKKNNTEYNRTVVVWIRGQPSNAYTFRQQMWPKPFISSVTPKMVSRGDMITLKGNFIGGENDSTKNVVRVKIDGHLVDFTVTKPGKEIETVVESYPPDASNKDCKTDAPPTKKQAGEYERCVVVIVNGQSSDEYLIKQLTWASVLSPRVLGALGLFVGGVLFVISLRRGNPFRSETKELSLSKIQMGIWTFVFGASYVILSAIWWEFLDITEGMFWLMGISSTTAVGAKAIVRKNIDPLFIGPPVPPSKLLSDWSKNLPGYRLSFHRVQIFLWTLIVLALYLVELYDTMHLPEIPEKLLVLMGISGGAYLGFNFPK